MKTLLYSLLISADGLGSVSAGECHTDVADANALLQDVHVNIVSPDSDMAGAGRNKVLSAEDDTDNNGAEAGPSSETGDPVNGMPVCADNDGFTDAFGFSCSDWYASECSSTFTTFCFQGDQGCYYPHDIEAVRQNCAVCGSCWQTWRQDGAQNTRCGSYSGHMVRKIVSSQNECQLFALRNGHSFYSFRHRERRQGGHKCETSEECDQEHSNHWAVYVAPPSTETTTGPPVASATTSTRRPRGTTTGMPGTPGPTDGYDPHIGSSSRLGKR